MSDKNNYMYIIRDKKEVFKMEIKIHSDMIWLKDNSKAHEYEVEVWTDQGDTVFVGVDATNRTQAVSFVRKFAFKWIAGTGHVTASCNMTA
jgi:hypothetical protein